MQDKEKVRITLSWFAFSHVACNKNNEATMVTFRRMQGSLDMRNPV